MQHISKKKYNAATGEKTHQKYATACLEEGTENSPTDELHVKLMGNKK